MTSLNIAHFPTLGPMHPDDVQPFHYRVEAENLDRSAAWAARFERGEARALRQAADDFRSVAEKHSWHPVALRSMALRAQAHAERRASAGIALRGKRP